MSQPLVNLSGHDDAGESPEAGPDAIDGEENTANKHEGMFDCEHADTGPSLENNDRNERDNQFSVDESARWESEFNVGHDDIAKDRLTSSNSYCYGEKYGTMPPHESRSHEMEVFLDDNETEPMDELREQIANIPLRKVKELRDQLGIKLFNRTYFGNRGTASVNSASLERKTRVFKRDNPKRPREMPSKGAAVKFTNNSMNGRRVEKRYDPRFDSRCGAFDDYIFNRDYDFLNDLRRKEKKILRNELKEIEDKDLVMAEAVKKQIKRLENQEKSRKNMEMKKDIIREIRRSNNERLKQGKRPIYYRRAEIKARELEKKYEQLKKRNKLDKFMERREKKLSRTGARKPMVRQE
ncbi:hypothetical protein AB6A40_003899 [Gnathostoma spinigerum]|uniref:rRNA biogenesis protein RRP36 n=1 Tax=Gnathostoma spinigerum TaxID=75299 RepID=A0ABD6ELN1_9BILA